MKRLWQLGKKTTNLNTSIIHPYGATDHVPVACYDNKKKKKTSTRQSQREREEERKYYSDLVWFLFIYFFSVHSTLLRMWCVFFIQIRLLPFFSTLNIILLNLKHCWNSRSNKNVYNQKTITNLVPYSFKTDYYLLGCEFFYEKNIFSRFAKGNESKYVCWPRVVECIVGLGDQVLIT